MLRNETITAALRRWRATPEAKLALEVGAKLATDTAESLLLTDEEWSAYSAMLRLLARLAEVD